MEDTYEDGKVNEPKEDDTATNPETETVNDVERGDEDLQPAV